MARRSTISPVIASSTAASSADLDHSVLITDPATTSYQFSTLTSGVWYFAVVAVNAGGLEGPPTTLATKSI